MNSFLLKFLRFGFCASLLLLSVGAPAVAQEAAGSINLSFTGAGTVTKTQTSFVNTYDRKAKQFESGTVMATGRQPFHGSGYVEISNGTARIKLPSPMLPLLRSGQDGWFAINDFFMNDREITGTIRINALNKPKLRIDRNSGTISLESGFADFSGDCTLIKNDGSQRKF